MHLKRVAATGTISLTGLALVVPPGRQLVGGGLSLSGGVLAVLTVAVAACLFGAGLVFYRSDIRTDHLLRVAGWNLLGLVVLGLVLTLVALSQAGRDVSVAAPLFPASALLAVSAFAHVLIGVNDVRRIRARELATERQKSSVLNRLVRHDLRQDAQLLYGYAERARTDGEAADATLADDIRALGERLGGLNESMKRVQAIVEESTATRPVDVPAVLETAVSAVREEHPDASVTVDAPASLRVQAGDELAGAVRELVENAVEHGGPDASVRVVASPPDPDGDVEIRVADDGPGIPESERAVVAGEQEITPTTHASGLGLWIVRWTVEAYSGSLRFEEGAAGAAVVLRLPAA